MIITGIDPGKKGAICQVRCELSHLPQIELLRLCPIVSVGKKLEYDLKAMSDLLKGSEMVFIEKQQPFPKQGVVSTGSLMFGYGAWIGIAVAHNIPYHLVAPRTWKKVMLRDRNKDKNSSIIKAKEINPTINLKPTLQSRKDNEGLAEAFLIAWYGWLQFDGLK